LDIPRIFNITESAHRIHNPITPDKLATLGAALRLEPGARVLDLGSGSGEMLCTWARDHGVKGVGIDMSRLYTEQARLRAEELGVAGQVTFIHGDAAGYVSNEKVDVAACVGATWIAGGVDRRDHPHRRALLAAAAAYGRRSQGMSCPLHLRLSTASRASRVLRPPWL